MVAERFRVGWHEGCVVVIDGDAPCPSRVTVWSADTRPALAHYRLEDARRAWAIADWLNRAPLSVLAAECSLGGLASLILSVEKEIA